jgi:LysM repeat protein
MSTSTATRPTTTQLRAAARPATGGAGTSRSGAVRLTRRGRIVVTLLLLGLLLGAFVVFGGQSVATGDAGAAVPTRTVVVGEGDTLWDIASEVSDGDIRETVHEIEQLNSLPGPALVVGQEIAVPIR